jgi:putative hydrolase of the HAD superfamily
MPIRAVLWDVDDTLFDHGAADRDGLGRHRAAEGMAADAADPGRALSRWREVTAFHAARFRAGETDWDGHRRDRVRTFTGRDLTDSEAEQWFARFKSHYEASFALFPDVLPVLDVLAAGYRHGVLSNASLQVQQPKLRALGVRDRFEVLVCAVDIGVAKPEPAAFHTACEALGLPPAEVLYVGDEPDIDARGAAEAGLTGVWLDRTGAGGRPGLLRITGLDQLPALLRGDTRFGAPSSFG